MTATKPADVDELVQWMTERGASRGEIEDALAQAGIQSQQPRAQVVAWPAARGVFTLRPARVTARLHALAELADAPGGLSLVEYQRAKARILGGE